MGGIQHNLCFLRCKNNQIGDYYHGRTICVYDHHGHLISSSHEKVLLWSNSGKPFNEDEYKTFESLIIKYSTPKSKKTTRNKTAFPSIQHQPKKQKTYDNRGNRGSDNPITIQINSQSESFQPLMKKIKISHKKHKQHKKHKKHNQQYKTIKRRKQNLH